jgi:hypothetical protein
MPLFDRVKSQAQQTASQLAEKGKGAAVAGHAKFDELQAKHHIDGLLRDLGQLVYGQRTGRSTPGDAETIDHIVESISAIEAEHAKHSEQTDS